MSQTNGMTNNDFIRFAEFKIKANDEQINNMIASLQREHSFRLVRRL